MRVLGLGLDVDRLVTVLRVHDRRQHQAGRVGTGKPAIAVDGPLHGRAHAVTVAQIDVVAHADFIAVVQGRRARHRQQQAVEQFHPPTIPLHQRRQASPNTQVDTGAAVCGVVVPQVVALFVGDHFQGQLIMVAQENCPLAVGGNLRGLAQNVRDGEAIFLGQRHVHARHQWKVERHVAFIAVITLSVAKVQLRVFGPLVGFGQQHAVGVMGVDLGADLLEDVVGFRQVFVVGAVPFDQVGNGVQAQAVDAQVEPIAHHRQHRFHDLRVIKVEVGLVRVKAVPEVLAGHRVPGPVGLFGVEENNACAVVFLVIIRPHVEVPCGRAWLGLARALEPGVLVGGVVDHQFSDHAQPALVGLGNKALGVGHRPVVAVHAAVFGNVVAVITPGRRVERQQPDGVHA